MDYYTLLHTSIYALYVDISNGIYLIIFSCTIHQTLPCFVFLCFYFKELVSIFEVAIVGSKFFFGDCLKCVLMVSLLHNGIFKECIISHTFAVISKWVKLLTLRYFSLKHTILLHVQPYKWLIGKTTHCFCIFRFFYQLWHFLLVLIYPKCQNKSSLWLFLIIFSKCPTRLAKKIFLIP